MTTLAKLPNGFDPAFAPQTMTGGNMAPQINRMGYGNGFGTGTAGTPTNTGKDRDWLGFLGNFLEGNGGTLLGGAGTIAAALNTADQTRDMGQAMFQYMQDLGIDLNKDSQFQGYGVTTGLGTGQAGYDDQGNFGIDLGLDDPQNTAAAGAANAAFGAAQNAATQAGIPIADRQNTIYNQIMATQNPELNRMQAEQQAAEYARGRGGIRGSQYGGTAEDAAMARARAMASNDAAFQAREMANQERGMLGQLAGQFGQYGNQSLQASYLPMQQQMALLGLGQQNADMAQTGQLTGLDYMAQLGLGGANANINAMHSANQLTGNLYNAILSNLGGVQDSDGGAGSGILGAIGGGLFGNDGLFGPDGPLRS